MDVKGLVRNILPMPSQAAKEARKAVKADSTTDRDANGQQAQSGEQEQKRRKLTPEEIQNAVKTLEALSGVKDHNLRVRLVQADGVSVVLIEDSFGKVVRRIPENELGALTADKEKKSGHLFDKAM